MNTYEPPITPIEGFDGYYVSTAGHVYSYRNHCLRRIGRRDGSGYIKVKLCQSGKRTQRYVHEIVLTTFVGPRPKGAVARHRDGDQQNNALSNLTWGSRAENVYDRHINKGSSSSGLTVADVKEIRRRAKVASVADLAEAYGVSKKCIRSIIQRRSWAFVP